MTVLNPPIVQGATTTNADDMRGQITAGLGGTSLMKPREGIAAGWGAELSVAQSGTPAMNVVVGSGQCLVAAPTAGHGGWWVINDASLTRTIAAAHASNPRTDLIIARVADLTYHTGGDGLADIKVITGVAGAGAPVPTVPTAEGAHIVLARVAVAANATSITNANITLNTSTTRPMIGPGVMVAADAGKVPLIVQGATSQTAVLAEFRDGTGAALTWIDASGVLNLAGSSASGVYMKNRSATPGTPPSGQGWLFMFGGNLYFRGSSGVDRLIASA